MSLPQFALSIRQPWAWLIVEGHKDIENRDWKPWNPGLKFRGPVCIHAGKLIDSEAADEMHEGFHPVTGAHLAASIKNEGYERGCIVGTAEIVDVVTKSSSEWFVGPYGLVIANAKPVPAFQCKGALGFFDWRKVGGIEP